MSDFYRVKPKEINSGPTHGIYVTKEERNRTIVVAAVFLLISFFKRKVLKKFKR